MKSDCVSYLSAVDEQLKNHFFSGPALVGGQESIWFSGTEH